MAKNSQKRSNETIFRRPTPVSVAAECIAGALRQLEDSDRKIAINIAEIWLQQEESNRHEKEISKK